MKPVKKLYFAGVSSLDIEWLKKKSPINVLIPFHHLVSDERVSYIDPLYGFKNSRQFEEDLDYLLKHFQPVTLSQVVEQSKSGKPFAKTSFLITFDDALKQVIEIASPILQRKGVPAALFVNPAFAGNKSLFYDLKKGLILDHLEKKLPTDAVLKKLGTIFNLSFNSVEDAVAAVKDINYLDQQRTDDAGEILGIDFNQFVQQQKPFMNEEQIKWLTTKDFEIGGHSMDHPLYRLIGLEEQVRQTIESAEWVQKTFQTKYKTFAFPHVDEGVSHAFFSRLVDGANPPVDFIFGNSTGMMENHPNVLHRFIGENPEIPIRTMAKAVLAYGVARKLLNKQFVHRN